MLYFKLQPTEENAKVIIALDGNFQLRRLKCAGNDIGVPLIKDRFIMKQEQYDEWINSHYSSRHKQPINNSQVSSNFCLIFYILYNYYINFFFNLRKIRVVVILKQLIKFTLKSSLKIWMILGYLEVHADMVYL